MPVARLTTTERDQLVRAARTAAKFSYSPYSHYPVGAAILTDDGQTFTGCNIENASYPAGICAERVAVFKAVSEGQMSFRAIAVVTRNGGSPCGICRQVLFEFGPDMALIIADMDQITLETTVTDLLPHGFGPHHLA